MEATISQRRLTRSPNQHPSLPQKSIITLFDAPNSPHQNPNPDAGIPFPIPIPNPPLQVLFSKDLTRTDIAENRVVIHDRFRPTLFRAFTDAERRELHSDSVRVVATMEDDSTEYPLRLKRKTTSGSMVLQSRWRDLANRHRLAQGDTVVAYGHRNSRNRHGQLRLVIKIIR